MTEWREDRTSVSGKDCGSDMARRQEESRYALLNTHEWVVGEAAIYEEILDYVEKHAFSSFAQRGVH